MNKGGNEDFSFVHFAKDVQLFDIVFWLKALILIILKIMYMNTSDKSFQYQLKKHTVLNIYGAVASDLNW